MKNLDKDKILELYNEGLFEGQIAKQLSIPQNVVWYFLKKNNLRSNRYLLAEKRENLILELFKQNKTNKEISELLSISVSLVQVYLDKNNINNNTRRLNVIDELHAICKKCNNVKLISEFQYGRKGTPDEYRYAFCNDCRRKQVCLNLNSDIDKFLSDKYNRLKRTSLKNNILFTISKEEFIEQYNAQKGLCFYTEIEMVCKAGEKRNKNSLSIDKIIPEKGYCKGNIVFCSIRINICKNNLSLQDIEKYMPAWYRKIQDFLK